ncbi:MAG: SGNH/GDSL hydrolase family protein [Planctomycetota bacterium]|nr:SGNH/GDSL hydrolase family protein [Planctomycetota bacterium]
MHKLLIVVLVSILIAANFSATARAVEPKRERIEWADIWVVNADKTDIPRVLMVGDSITKGYYDGVDRHLRGKAACARLATSKCICDPAFLPEVKLLLDNYKFAVIHFNNGLHGYDYSNKQYADAFAGLLKTFKKCAPKAKLIWANSTPTRKSSNLKEFNEGNNRVNERNLLAKRIMEKHNIPINDLNKIGAEHPEFYSSDGTHYNAKGKAAQAKQVADMIMKQLSE